MNIIIYLFIIVGIFFTFKNVTKIIKNDFKIPNLFFLSWKFIIHIIGLLFISISIYYAKSEIEFITFLAIISGLILGLINAVFSTVKKTGN